MAAKRFQALLEWDDQDIAQILFSRQARGTPRNVRKKLDAC